ncbi:hypothetical protein [Rhodopila globiformis]|jgi:hypothetical protein|uniref:hypothetical protein n=1 Tax=Rhodopila globiformis TaxID=1071 RepID=UPI0011B0149E|nr:hypothetical protein [Rhodopila globiformis]
MVAPLCKALILQPERRRAQTEAVVVKRHKEEDIAGILEFAGRSSEDPEFQEWLAEHKARHGGKIRVSKGLTGVRVMFAKSADMALWQRRSDEAAKGKKSAA